MQNLVFSLKKTQKLWFFRQNNEVSWLNRKKSRYSQSAKNIRQ